MVLRSKRRFLQSAYAIDQYRAAVHWAVGVADKLLRPVEVMPVSYEEYLDLVKQENAHRSFNSHDDCHFELFQEMVRSMLETLSDEDDSEKQEIAHWYLADIGVSR